MFPLCLPFVTPGTEMSLRKETRTHTPRAEDTRSVRSAEATELVCENKWKGGRKKTHEQETQKETNETQMYSRRGKHAGNCANERKWLKNISGGKKNFLSSARQHHHHYDQTALSLISMTFLLNKMWISASFKYSHVNIFRRIRLQN